MSEAPARHPGRRPFAAIWRHAPTIAWCVVAIGLLLRWTARDGWPLLHVVYYATPLPVLALLAAFAGVLHLRRRRRPLAVAGALAFVVLCALHVMTSCFPARSELAADPARAVRVVLWNVNRGMFGWSSLPERLARFDADLICLVESRRLDAHDRELQAALPEHTSHHLEGGLSVLVRGELRDAYRLDVAAGTAARVQVQLRATGEGIDLVLVDVPSNPFASRAPFFEQLASALGDGPQPQMLLGDFNTPRTSVCFDALRRDMRHAFEAVGCGFVETWPVILPVLDLDHVWLRTDVVPVACRYEAGWASDHAAVVVEAVLRAD